MSWAPLTHSAAVRTLSGVAIALALVTAPASARQNRAPLKIVVIEGEGAVNIIQQKTAVAPVIEVRDRNDQPVAGATVNFVVRAGRATFSGARTLSVTTNAAGQAAAAGFTPGGAGALQIGATATFQGQAAAAVTIAQTNVMTAAEAAAVSSASGAGGSGSGAAGGGAGGGGMSTTTTLAIVGGAIAGGAVVATETVFAGNTFEGPFSGVLNLTSVNESGFPGCTNIENMTATVKFSFDSIENAISGEMAIDDTDMKLAPGTCPPDGYNTGTDAFPSDSGTVSGSRDNVIGHATHRNDYNNMGYAGVNAYEYSFTGRFDSDEQITGMLTIERIVTGRPVGGGSGTTSRGSVTSQVVLRKK